MLCIKCRQSKGLSEFSKGKKRCKLCTRDYYKDWYLRHKKSELIRAKKSKSDRAKELRPWLDSLKKRACLDCHEHYKPWQMDFDHLSNKRFSVSSMVTGGFSREAILKEIKKCELVCANCHRDRTHKRRISIKGDALAL